MKYPAFVAAAMLTGLTACSPGGLMPAPASNASSATNAAPAAAASTAPAGTYQVDLIPGSSQVSAVMVRMNTTTGAATLSAGDGAFIHVAEPTPPPAGAYKLMHFTTFDSNQANRTWDMYRIETSSGRTWYLNYDGQSAASWAEIASAP